MISGLGGILAIIGLVLISLPLVIGGVFVILVVSNRADPDPSGRRPAVVYSYALSFIALFVTLFATFDVVVNLVTLIGSHQSASASNFSSFGSLSGALATSGSQHPIGDAAARGIVIGLLVALVAGAAYLIHVRTADRATNGFAPVDPPGRVRSSYVAAVSFVCVVIVVIALVVAAYQVFRIIAPGVFNSGGDGSRIAALRTMLPLVYLALASAWLLRRHLWQVPPESRPMFGWPPGGRPDPAPDTVADTMPLAVEVEVLEVAPTPRKRAPAKRTTRRTPPKT
jgi:hypothetical protein